MRSVWKTVPAFGVFALMFGSTANAADMGSEPLPPLLENAPLLVDEFSSGWYLRGDVGYRWNDLDDVSNRQAPAVQRNDLDNSWVVGAGVGYKWEWFRTDFTVDYGTKAEFLGDSNRRTNDFHAKIDSVTGLVNVYGDLGTWYGFTPYVGAGIGFAHLGAADFFVRSAGAGDTESTGSWNFAWAAMAGVSYQVMGNYHIDVGYRYVNMGDVETGRDDVGNRLNFKTVTSNEVRVGFRYVLD